MTNRRPTAAELLENRHGVLTRSDIRALGHERRSVDAIFRACPVVYVPGYSRPMVKVADYLAMMESSTYSGDDRVHP
jgi:hypothetical protein